MCDLWVAYHHGCWLLKANDTLTPNLSRTACLGCHGKHKTHFLEGGVMDRLLWSRNGVLAEWKLRLKRLEMVSTYFGGHHRGKRWDQEGVLTWRLLGTITASRESASKTVNHGKLISTQLKTFDRHLKTVAWRE